MSNISPRSRAASADDFSSEDCDSSVYVIFHLLRCPVFYSYAEDLVAVGVVINVGERMAFFLVNKRRLAVRIMTVRGSLMVVNGNYVHLEHFISLSPMLLNRLFEESLRG